MPSDKKKHQKPNEQGISSDASAVTAAENSGYGTEKTSVPLSATTQGANKRKTAARYAADKTKAAENGEKTVSKATNKAAAKSPEGATVTLKADKAAENEAGQKSAEKSTKTRRKAAAENKAEATPDNNCKQSDASPKTPKSEADAAQTAAEKRAAANQARAAKKAARPRGWFWKSKAFKICAALCVIMCATAVALHFALAGSIDGGKDDDGNAGTETAVSVRVTEINPTSSSVSLRYVASMQPETLEYVTYNQISTVTAIFVEVGQSVKAGDKLATVDSETAQREVNAAKYTLSASESAVERAQLNYDYAVSEYERAQQEALPETNLDYYEYQVEIAKTTLDEAKAERDSAKEDYQSALSLYNDCTLRAGMNGYVVAVLASVGDMATPINPIVVIGSYKSVAEMGISASDVHSLAAGLECTITMSSGVYDGSVLSISRIPDSTSRTYLTRVTVPVEGETFLIGEIVSVEIKLGEREGVWIPISVIQNDGVDYVYTVVDGRAVKTTIVINDISNDLVRVTGLEQGGLLVTEGMKSLKTGMPVNIITD